jgi:hypothetical protein
MSEATVTGPVLDAAENSAPSQPGSVVAVKATLTPLTPAQQKLLGSLNPDTLATAIASGSIAKQTDKIKGLFHALEGIRDTADKNATYVGAYAHRALVKSKHNEHGTMTSAEFAAMLGVSEPRASQLGKSAQIAFDLRVDPNSDLWKVTSTAQNQTGSTDAIKASLTAGNTVALAQFFEDYKAKQAATKASRGKGGTLAGTKSNTSQPGTSATGDKRAAQTPPSGELTGNGLHIHNALEELRKVSNITAEDWAALLEVRNLIQATGEASTPAIRKSGQALHSRVNRKSA